MIRSLVDAYDNLLPIDKQYPKYMYLPLLVAFTCSSRYLGVLPTYIELLELEVDQSGCFGDLDNHSISFCGSGKYN